MMEKVNVKKAKWSHIIQYSFAQVINIPFLMTMMYVMYFFTDVFGISTIAAASVMAFARLLDSVTDPLMGILIDKTNTRWGKFRPWFFVGGILLSGSFALLLYSPNFSSTGKVVFAYIVYAIYSIGFTMIDIPNHSIKAMLSQDPTQRALLTIPGNVVTNISMLLVMVLTFPLVDRFGGGQAGWRIVGIFLGIILFIGFMITANGVKHYDNPKAYVGRKIPTLKEQFKAFTINKPLQMLTFAVATNQFASAATGTVTAYYFIYNLGRRDLMSIRGLITFGVSLLVTIAVIPFVLKFEKRTLFIWSSIGAIIPSIVLLFTPYDQITVILAALAVATVFGFTAGYLQWTMIPDCVEYSEWKTGVRAEGAITASFTFMNKLGSSAGGFISGVILAAVGYAAGQAQAPQVLKAILYMLVFFPIAGHVCSIISMSFYPITKKFFFNMLDDINKNKQETVNTTE